LFASRTQAKRPSNTYPLVLFMFSIGFSLSQREKHVYCCSAWLKLSARVSYLTDRFCALLLEVKDVIQSSTGTKTEQESAT
jgi:hypothetical protein